MLTRSDDSGRPRLIVIVINGPLGLWTTWDFDRILMAGTADGAVNAECAAYDSIPPCWKDVPTKVVHVDDQGHEV